MFTLLVLDSSPGMHLVDGELHGFARKAIACVLLKDGLEGLAPGESVSGEHPILRNVV